MFLHEGIGAPRTFCGNGEVVITAFFFLRLKAFLVLRIEKRMTRARTRYIIVYADRVGRFTKSNSAFNYLSLWYKR